MTRAGFHSFVFHPHTFARRMSSSFSNIKLLAENENFNSKRRFSQGEAI